MGRLLGIDYGKARIGVAISDETHLLARPLCCLDNKPDFFDKLKTELKSYTIDQVILGLPLLMNGQDSPLSLEVRQFSQKLEDILQIPLILWDERLTSAQVEKSLKDFGVKRKKRAEVSDVLAASLILQSYLDFKGISLQPYLKD